jgi:hypothetical protein
VRSAPKPAVAAMQITAAAAKLPNLPSARIIGVRAF